MTKSIRNLTADDRETLRHMTYTGRLLQRSVLDTEGATPAELNHLRQSVNSALLEMAYGISGSALTAYSGACAIQGGDEGWHESGTLQELQTVCLLSDLMLLLANYNNQLNAE